MVYSDESQWIGLVELPQIKHIDAGLLESLDMGSLEPEYEI